jgi:ankyrin repeat protein
VQLHQAAVLGQADEVARLIAAGEDVAAADKQGLTPLHMAAMQDMDEVAAILIAAGSPVMARDSFGNTPLHRAVFAFKGGDPTLIRLLLDAGADPDAPNTAGKSPREVGLLFNRPGIGSVFS